MKLSPNEAGRVLAHGIDSLVLAIDVRWLSSLTFERLEKLKRDAKGEQDELSSICDVGFGQTPWLCAIKPYGLGGYEWVLTSRELTMRIGNWLEPKQRPSVMVDVRSETLWTHGPDAVVDRIRDILSAMSGEVLEVKPSRVDLCCDILLREEAWDATLRDCFVTRARDIATYTQGQVLTGFSIGKGDTSARLYDKPLEIRAKSRKFWMYDCWGIESCGEDHRIIRVEFQLRRQTIKELGVGIWEELGDKLPSVWAYCTRRWLRLVEDASLHHTQQKERAWWGCVKSGFEGAQDAEPLVRAKSIAGDMEQLVAQVMGSVSSMVALLRQGELIGQGELLDLESHVAMIANLVRRSTRQDDQEFTERVKRKQAKKMRNATGFKASAGAPLPLAVSLKAKRTGRTKHQ